MKIYELQIYALNNIYKAESKKIQRSINENNLK